MATNREHHDFPAKPAKAGLNTMAKGRQRWGSIDHELAATAMP
jgi:hypothetical protein